MNDSEKIAAMETKVATLEGRAPDIEQALKVHEARINGHDQGVNDIERRLSNLATRLDVLDVVKQPSGPSRASRAWTWLKENRPPVKDLVLWVLIAVMFAGMVVMFLKLQDRPPGPVPPGPTPTPPVPPKPPAPIPGPGLRVLIVYESSQALPSAQQVILTSKTVLDYLRTKCSPTSDGMKRGWYIVDKDTDFGSESKVWQDAMARPRQSIPWIIVSNGVTGTEESLPADVAATMALLQKFGG